MRKLVLVVAALASCLAASNVSAESNGSIADKFRMPGRSPFALHVGAALNDPIPAVFGLQAAVSFHDWVRLQVGVGRFSSTYRMPDGTTINPTSTTWGVGIRGRLPQFTLSPVIGVSFASIHTEGFPSADRHVYLAAGFEWRPWSDLEVGAGYTRSFDPRIGGLPYVTTAWNVSL